jgi:hypothetical protein
MWRQHPFFCDSVLVINFFFIFMKFVLGVLHEQLSSYVKIGSVTAILYL